MLTREPSIKEMTAAMVPPISSANPADDGNGLIEGNFPSFDLGGFDIVPPPPGLNICCNSDPFLSSDHAPHSANSTEDSNTTLSLKYISRVLLEEEEEEVLNNQISSSIQQCLALRSMEKQFYKILRGKDPALLHLNWHPFRGESIDVVSSAARDHLSACRGVLSSSNDWYQFSNSSNYFGSVAGGRAEHLDPPTIPKSYYGSQLNSFRCKKIKEEASKLLPTNVDLLNSLQNHRFSPKGTGRKQNPYRDDLDPKEQRCSKQAAILYNEEILRTEMLDKLVLRNDGEYASFEEMREDRCKIGVNQQLSNIRPSLEDPKKKGRKKQVDLIPVLIQCAQAIASNDVMGACEILQKITSQSSPLGDTSKTVAHYFALGLEARLAGKGSQLYKELWNPIKTMLNKL